MFKPNKLKLIFSVFLLFALIRNSNCADENEGGNDQLTTSEPIVAVRIIPPGAPEELSPNLVGLANIAIVHLPQTLHFDHIIKATREIVDGVLYDILVNTKDSDRNDVICSIVILEKPWITNEWGDKLRILRYSNCSTVQEDDKPFDPSKYNKNTIFNKENTVLTTGDITHLESQIIQTPKVSVNQPKVIENDADIRSSTSRIPQSSGDILADILGDIELQIVKKKTPPNKPSSDNDVPIITSTEESVVAQDIPRDSTHPETTTACTTCTESESSDSGVKPSPSADNTKHNGMSEDIKTMLDSLFLSNNFDLRGNLSLPNDPSKSKRPVEPENNPTKDIVQEPLMEKVIVPAKITPQQTDESQPSISNEIQTKQYLPSDVPCEKETNVEQTDTVKPDINHSDNTNQHNEPEIIEQNSNDAIQEIIPIDTQPLNSANEIRSEDPNFIKVIPLPISNEHQSLRKKRQINNESYIKELARTAIQQLNDADIRKRERFLIDIISFNYTKISDEYYYIINAKYGERICAELTPDSKGCNKYSPSMKRKICSFEISVKDGNKKLVQSECAPVPGLVGGPSCIDEAEVLPLIEQALAKLSAQGGQSYQNVKKIHSAKQQVVAGKLYTIVGEFMLDDVNSANCTLTIWSRPWIKVDGTEVTIDCDEKPQQKTRYRRSVDTEDEGFLVDKASELFSAFKQKYNKQYSSTADESLRYKIFLRNLNKIDTLNMLEMGTAKYDVTEFADLTVSEYRQRTGLLPKLKNDNDLSNPVAKIHDLKLPNSWDWREKGVISKVKNQGNCGSCWAFSVTGNIEGLHAIKTGTLEEYSEQELLDCDSVDKACSGGLPDNAYKAIEQIGGLELESEYPYQAKKAKSCAFKKDMAHVRVKGAIDLPKNETAMAQWLVQNGPISIGINANAMQFYRGGVSHPWRPLCRHGSIDHGVLIVGYGVVDYPVFNKTLPYWIVKNSWGESWGEQGYYRVYRGDNTCGINSMASSAILQD